MNFNQVMRTENVVSIHLSVCVMYCLLKIGAVNCQIKETIKENLTNLNFIANGGGLLIAML